MTPKAVEYLSVISNHLRDYGMRAVAGLTLLYLIGLESHTLKKKEIKFEKKLNFILLYRT